jgi:hypothetical protein
MARLSHLALWLIAALFTLIGLRWHVDPRAAANSLGMPLLDGMARSTQIGDLSAVFFTLAALLLLGLQTGRDSWLHAAALLLGFIALNRALAWALHAAPFATEFIVVELVLAGMILLAARGRTG